MAEIRVVAPRGLEGVLVAELVSLGLGGAREVRGGARALATLAEAYRVCLWSRVASRVLWSVARVPAGDAEALYRGVGTVDWSEHVDPDGSIAVRYEATRSALSHPQFGAQRVKDAIVDRLREQFGRRPDVDREDPDVRVHVTVREDVADVAIDLAGEGLHRRGGSRAVVAAPIKENVAAGILLRAGWPARVAQGASLVDPMAGSGTFALEAARIAADAAPGLGRRKWGFTGWRGHDPAAWATLHAEATARVRPAPGGPLSIVAWDADPVAITRARANAADAGLASWIRMEPRALSSIAPVDLPAGPGLVVTNPPYGVRLHGHGGQAPEAVLAELGGVLKSCFAGWQAWVLCGDETLARALGLSAERRTLVYNGPIACRLVQVEIHDRPRTPRPRGGEHEAFANRLRKNVAALAPWAAGEDVHAYRLYDADVPEYAVAVDRYEDHVVVQEYAAPADVDERKAARRLQAVIEAVPEVLGVAVDHVHLKVRRRRPGRTQVERLQWEGRFHPVREGGLELWCNFDDYLDTGLFLDHRPTRALLRGMARGRRFLNLFGYTGTASVYAAAGGARTVVTVDLSKTYLDWARHNFERNRLDPGALVHADARDWVRDCAERFDLVYVDVPTFSTSKRMTGTWDVSRDHEELLADVTRLLAPDARLVFSCNARRFRLRASAPRGWSWREITAETIPRDFARSPRVHQSWILEP